MFGLNHLKRAVFFGMFSINKMSSWKVNHLEQLEFFFLFFFLKVRQCSQITSFILTSGPDIHLHLLGLTHFCFFSNSTFGPACDRSRICSHPALGNSRSHFYS